MPIQHFQNTDGQVHTDTQHPYTMRFFALKIPNFHSLHLLPHFILFRTDFDRMNLANVFSVRPQQNLHCWVGDPLGPLKMLVYLIIFSV